MAHRRLAAYLRIGRCRFTPGCGGSPGTSSADLRRKHIRAGNRTVAREEPPPLSDASATELAERLFARSSSPSARMQRHERQAGVRAALARLAERDREVLVLRHLEQLPTPEIAAVLEVSEGAVYTRHLRALRRLRDLLGPDYAEGM